MSHRFARLSSMVRISLIAGAVLIAAHVNLRHSSMAYAGFGHNNYNPYPKPVSHRVYPSMLFSNYYVGPAFWADGVPAQLYPSPLPTPPLVGHTYITYEPLKPHEFMYHHKRSYYRHNPGEGWSNTHVWYW